MASKKTEHLKMNDWLGADPFRREELNENFRKIDANAKAVAEVKADKTFVDGEIAGVSAQLADIVTNINSYENIQAAIDNAKSRGGGKVLVPAGTHNFSTKITIPSSVTLSGVGKQSSVLNFTGTGTAIEIIGSASNTIYSGLENIGLVSNAATVAIDIKKAYYLNFDDVDITGQNQTGIGIRVDANGVVGYYGTFIKVKVSNFDTGVKLQSNANAHRFFGCNFYGCNNGLEISDSNGIAIFGSAFQDFRKRGIYLTDTGVRKTQSNIISGNYFEAIYGGADVICGIEIATNCVGNSIYGNKYSNLRSASKPELIDNGDVTTRLEYNSQSYKETMKLGTFTNLPKFDESSKPAVIDEMLGALAYCYRTGARDILRAVLQNESDVTKYASILHEIDGIALLDGIQLNNVQQIGSVGPITQYNNGYIKVGTQNTAGAGNFSYDATAKTVGVHDGAARRHIITTSFAAGAPTFSATYRGQEYTDTTNLVTYKAVQVGTGATDWKQITN